MYAAESAEVQQLTQQAIARIVDGLSDVADPLARYTELSAQQALEDAVRRAVVGEILRLRGQELRRMSDAGLTYEQIAEATGLGTKQRVSQLIASAGK